MADFHSARVREAWDETAGLRGLRLDVPDAALRTHRRAGQYLKLRTGAAEGFFALASPPGSPIAELLIKRGGAVGDAVAALPAGTDVLVSEVQGKGYPLEEHAGRDLLLFAAGSGIAPIRAVIEAVRGARARFGAVTAYYGQRRSADFAYRAQEAEWAASGIALVAVASRPDGEPWSGATGHVQDALRARPPDLQRAAAFLCGMKGMVQGVTEALLALGLPADRIHLNY